MRSQLKAIRWAGIIAVAAALLAVIADLALQYTPNAAHLLSPQNLYLLDVSSERLLLGHYLGVVAILIEIVGVWQIYRALQPAGARFALPFFLIGAFGNAIGAVFHATAVFVGLTLHAQQGTTGATYQAFAALLTRFNAAIIGLAIPALVGIALSALWYAFVVGFKPTAYPRWMADCNPLTFLLVIVALARSIPRLFAHAARSDDEVV